jgi:DNA transformation protein and related proteins
MSSVETWPNIGKVLADRLKKAGIETDTQLKTLGDAKAFLRLRAELPDDACVHTRLALAGAVRGVRWHDLDETLRHRLADEARA